MTQVDDRVAEAMKASRDQDQDVREVMGKALEIDGEPPTTPTPEQAAERAYKLLAMEVAVALANVVRVLRRSSEARTFRVVWDLVIGLNTNAFWNQHAKALLPVLHMALVDHLDSVSMQMERGETKISPYDNLIMGAEASCLQLFSMILFLTGGQELQLKHSVILKKALKPLLMK